MGEHLKGDQDQRRKYTNQIHARADRHTDTGGRPKTRSRCETLYGIPIFEYNAGAQKTKTADYLRRNTGRVRAAIARKRRPHRIQ